MGLFNKSKTVPLNPMTQPGQLAAPSHTTWEADYGKKRVPELKQGTAQLLVTTEAMKEATVVGDAQLATFQEFWTRQFRDLDQYLESKDMRTLSGLSLFLDVTFESLDRHNRMFPDASPFAALDADALTRLPNYLYGKQEASAWPLVYGYLTGEAEQRLGWPRPRGLVDRRTWAALSGWSFLEIRRTLEVPPFQSRGDESVAQRVVVGKFLMLTQRSLMRGYSTARG